MSAVESAVLVITLSCGVVSLAAAVLASRHYSARRRKRTMEQMAQRRSSAVGQLQDWRDEGILIIQEKALEAAIYWEKADPDNLERLVHAIQTFIEEEGIGPGTDNPLVLAIARRNATGGKTEKRGASRRRLELIAAFG